MSTDDTPTQIMTPPPGKPRKPRWRRWYVITPAALAAGIIMISALGGHSAPAKAAAPAAHPSSPAATAPAKAKATTYPAQAADETLCTTFNTDMTSGDTTDVATALQQAGGSVSSGLAKDVGVVANESGTVSQDVTNQLHVAMDSAPRTSTLTSTSWAPAGRAPSTSTATRAPTTSR